MTVNHEHEAVETVAGAHNIPVVRSNTVMTEAKYNFRKDELGNKRASVTVALPYITIDGLVEALGDEKVQSYILEIINTSIYDAGKVQVNDDEKPVNSQDELDLSKLTLEFLANQPAAERRGGGISKEVWEAWAADYLEVMPGATGKKKENVGNAATLFLKKFQPVKTDKPVLAKLKEQLDIYTTATERLEEFQDCVTFLINKVESLIASDSAKLLENL
jgi:hypothetical protein